MQEIPVRSLGWEDPLEKGKATHIPVFWPGEFHGLSMGSQRVRHDRATFTFTFLPTLSTIQVRSVAGASPWPSQRPLVVAAPPRRRRKWEWASSPKRAPSIHCPTFPSAPAQSVSLLAFKSWVYGGLGPPVKNWI